MVDRVEFNEVVDFHGCYCLDIAMGYRVAKALVREMGEQLTNMKEVFAQVGNITCAVDAIQKITGCTLGKRNLILSDLGKPVFILQNGRTGHAVRAYVSYWDSYDQDEIRHLKAQAKKSEDGIAQLESYLDEKIHSILSATEESLFSLEHLDLSAPEVFGKFDTMPCDGCGEFVNTRFLQSVNEKMLCKECE